MRVQREEGGALGVGVKSQIIWDLGSMTCDQDAGVLVAQE